MIKNPAQTSDHLDRDYGASLKCPKCHNVITNTDISSQWPVLPVGVKFDPSDTELLDYLAAKCDVGNKRPHIFMDDFIPTLEGDQGICYTHPENLPGAKTDGSSVHFFHRRIYAYHDSHRKRRKIQTKGSTIIENCHWHTTGRTKQVTENGVHKGCKRIMVLYENSSKRYKGEKSNWVMHQYHLGTDDDKKEGEYIVSKIFHQQKKQREENAGNLAMEDADIRTLQPHNICPDPLRENNNVSGDELPKTAAEEMKLITEKIHEPTAETGIEGAENCFPGRTNNSSLLSKDMRDNSLNNENSNDISVSHYSNDGNINQCAASFANNSSYGMAELENFGLYTPPDLLSAFQLGSPYDILDWLDHWL